MRRASAQIFSIGSHRKKHFSFGFRCGILSLVCRCFLKNSILYTEKLKIRIKYSFFHCRSPHGERGLKYRVCGWRNLYCRRSPHGERGLKCTPPAQPLWSQSRSPHGERGLKSDSDGEDIDLTPSLPTRGAWIEMMQEPLFCMPMTSLPTRGAWIEISPCRGKPGLSRSLPTRGAWIEIIM